MASKRRADRKARPDGGKGKGPGTDLRGLLDEAEAGPRTPRRTKPDREADLDLDGAWDRS